MMNIGNVIKKYRKELGYTQEEMANRLGVTTPAVNKWENGNSNPDIELLAPIARLLHISLDTLLSFRENLTDIEIEELIHKMDKMFSEEGFEKTYQWAVNTIKEYPNCNLLIWQLAVMLDSRRILTGTMSRSIPGTKWRSVIKRKEFSTMQLIPCSASICGKRIMKWQKNI